MASTEIDFSLTPFLLALLRAFRARLGANDVLDGVDEVRFINLNTVEGIENPSQDIVIYFDNYEIEPDHANDPGDWSDDCKSNVSSVGVGEAVGEWSFTQGA